MEAPVKYQEQGPGLGSDDHRKDIELAITNDGGRWTHAALPNRQTTPHRTTATATASNDGRHVAVNHRWAINQWLSSFSRLRTEVEYVKEAASNTIPLWNCMGVLLQVMLMNSCVAGYTLDMSKSTFTPEGYGVVTGYCIAIFVVNIILSHTICAPERHPLAFIALSWTTTYAFTFSTPLLSYRYNSTTSGFFAIPVTFSIAYNCIPSYAAWTYIAFALAPEWGLGSRTRDPSDLVFSVLAVLCAWANRRLVDTLNRQHKATMVEAASERTAMLAQAATMERLADVLNKSSRQQQQQQQHHGSSPGESCVITPVECFAVGIVQCEPDADSGDEEDDDNDNDNDAGGAKRKCGCWWAFWRRCMRTGSASGNGAMSTATEYETRMTKGEAKSGVAVLFSCLSDSCAANGAHAFISTGWTFVYAVPCRGDASSADDGSPETSDAAHTAWAIADGALTLSRKILDERASTGPVGHARKYAAFSCRAAVALGTAVIETVGCVSSEVSRVSGLAVDDALRLVSTCDKNCAHVDSATRAALGSDFGNHGRHLCENTSRATVEGAADVSGMPGGKRQIRDLTTSRASYSSVARGRSYIIHPSPDDGERYTAIAVSGSSSSSSTTTAAAAAASTAAYIPAYLSASPASHSLLTLARSQSTRDFTGVIVVPTTAAATAASATRDGAFRGIASADGEWRRPETFRNTSLDYAAASATTRSLEDIDLVAPIRLSPFASPPPLPAAHPHPPRRPPASQPGPVHSSASGEYFEEDYSSADAVFYASDVAAFGQKRRDHRSSDDHRRQTTHATSTAPRSPGSFGSGDAAGVSAVAAAAEATNGSSPFSHTMQWIVDASPEVYAEELVGPSMRFPTMWFGDPTAENKFVCQLAERGRVGIAVACTVWFIMRVGAAFGISLTGLEITDRHAASATDRSCVKKTAVMYAVCAAPIALLAVLALVVRPNNKKSRAMSMLGVAVSRAGSGVAGALAFAATFGVYSTCRSSDTTAFVLCCLDITFAASFFDICAIVNIPTVAGAGLILCGFFREFYRISAYWYAPLFVAFCVGHVRHEFSQRRSFAAAEILCASKRRAAFQRDCCEHTATRALPGAGAERVDAAIGGVVGEGQDAVVLVVDISPPRGIGPPPKCSRAAAKITSIIETEASAAGLVVAAVLGDIYLLAGVLESSESERIQRLRRVEAAGKRIAEKLREEGCCGAAGIRLGMAGASGGSGPIALTGDIAYGMAGFGDIVHIARKAAAEAGPAFGSGDCLSPSSRTGIVGMPDDILAMMNRNDPVATILSPISLVLDSYVSPPCGGGGGGSSVDYPPSQSEWGTQHLSVQPLESSTAAVAPSFADAPLQDVVVAAAAQPESASVKKTTRGTAR